MGGFRPLGLPPHCFRLGRNRLKIFSRKHFFVVTIVNFFLVVFVFGRKGRDFFLS